MTIEGQAIRSKAKTALSNQSFKTVTVLSSLLAVHDSLGYLPTEAIDEVAKYTKTTANDVWAVASFYTNFRFTNPPPDTLELCWGPSCHIRGAMPMLQKVFDHFGLEQEGDSPDKKVQVRLNTCLGACSQAPVISVNHQLVGNLDPDNACATIDNLLQKRNRRKH